MKLLYCFILGLGGGSKGLWSEGGTWSECFFKLNLLGFAFLKVDEEKVVDGGWFLSVDGRACFINGLEVREEFGLGSSVGPL